MKTYTAGYSASKGIVIGNAYVLEKTVLRPSDAVSLGETLELERFVKAVEATVKQLTGLAKENDILDAYLQLVQDRTLMDGVQKNIQRGFNAEQALVDTAEELKNIFETMQDAYMRERAADVQDVCERLLYQLKGVSVDYFEEIHTPVILVAKKITTSEFAGLDKKMILGLVTEEGGVTSHVSIMARNAGIPARVGVSGISEEICSGEEIILDTVKNVIVVQPDENTKAVYQKRQKRFQDQQEELENIIHLPTVTTDGHQVLISANVGSLEEVYLAMDKGSDRIGLFRTEFLYMEKTDFPTEEEQYEIYKKAAECCGKELTIRTLDIGGDKELPYYKMEKEQNPFLGWRAIRVSLKLREVFKTQLRAVLRAAVYGNVRMMYPLIVSMEELMEANQILEECKAELEQEGVLYCSDLPVGMMVETPSAVLLADGFASKVDFFSIGINDLTQYILAVDRGNLKIAKMYDCLHPSVISAVQQIIDAGHRAGITVGMCGELADDSNAVKLFLGMGVDTFSVNAGNVPLIKGLIRELCYEKCKELATRVKNVHMMKEIFGQLEVY